MPSWVIMVVAAIILSVAASCWLAERHVREGLDGTTSAPSACTLPASLGPDISPAPDQEIPVPHWSADDPTNWTKGITDKAAQCKAAADWYGIEGGGTDVFPSAWGCSPRQWVQDAKAAQDGGVCVTPTGAWTGNTECGWWMTNCSWGLPGSAFKPRTAADPEPAGGFPGCKKTKTITTKGCTPGAVLDSGSSCNVQCVDGATSLGGTTAYSCAAGTTTAATLKCAPPVCTLPSQFATGIVPAKSTPCSPGDVMKDQESCKVECAAGYAGDGGSGTYSCAAGSLKRAALKCHKTDCALPSSFPDHMSGGGQNQCKAGGSLSTGESCDLACDPGYTSPGGALEYSCEDGTLTSPTGKCTEKGCQLPPTLGSGITAGDKDGCVADQKMKGGEQCNVKCAEGYKPVGGSSRYSCSKGQLTSATLRCEPITCPLPTQLGTGVEGKGQNPCVTGASLRAGQNCDVACKSGYRSLGGTTVYQCPDTGEMVAASLKCQRISCPLPHDFGEGVTWGGSSPCEPGSSLLGGEQCSVKCGMGYSAAGGNPNYVCGQTGALDKATLACSRNKCRLPASFGEGKTPGGENPCATGGTIDSGNSCSVQCAPGYKPISGDSEYMCDQRGILSDATLQCERISCTLPEDFGDGVMGTGDSPCSPGSPLIAGNSCEVKCEEGYDMVGEEVNYAHGGISKEFHCSGAGFLTEPGIKCKETKIRPYNSVWSIDFGGVLG